MLGVPVGVQQAHGNRLGLALGDLPDDGGCSFCGQFAHGAVGAHALGDAEAALRRGERRWPSSTQAVELAPVLASERDQIAKALGGEEHGSRAAALEQSVGGNGHPVRELVDVAGTGAGSLEHCVHGGQHALGLVLGRAGRLGRDQPAVRRPAPRR